MVFANAAGRVTSSPSESSGYLSSDYLEAYQLSFDPFNGVSDDASGVAHEDFVFYPGAQREQLLDQVAHLSQFSASVVVVAGEQGSGRTTLKSQLKLQLEERYRLTEISVDTLSKPEHVFGDIAFALGCDIPDEASPGEMISAIRHDLLNLQDEPLLVLIDDAHLLSDAVLSALVSLLQSSRDSDELPFQVVMFGDLNLIGRLDGFGMVDVLLHDVVLPPLSEEEMADYLALKLDAAGWEDDLPFDNAELEHLYSLAGGLPGSVHGPARELLVAKMNQQPTADGERNLGLPVGHIFSLVVLFGVLLMAFFYKDSWLGEEPVADQGVASERSATSVKVPLESSSSGASQSVRAASPDVASAQSGRSLAGVETGVKKPPAILGESSAPNNVQAADDVQAADEEEQVSAGQASVSQAPRNAKEAIAGSVDEGAPEKGVSGAEVSPAVSEKPSQVSLGTSSEGETSKLSTDERYLMSLAATHYVLQVMAASSESAVAAYINRQKNQDALRLFASTRSGKPWYVVVAGNYPSVEAARQGVASLPDEQKKAGPWPRSVEDVHLKIKEHRGI